MKAVPGNIVWGESDSMQMFMEAINPPREDDEEGGGSRRRGPALPVSVLQALVEMVMATPPERYVTRDDIEQHLGKSVDRKKWTVIDEHLNLHPTVIVDRGDKNRVQYRRRAEPMRPVVQ